MPRKKRPAKKPDAEYTRLVIRVTAYDLRVEAGINSDVYNARYAYNLNENDPLYTFTSYIDITGQSTDPPKRTGETYNLSISGDDAPSRDLNATLSDVQLMDEHHMPQYQTYRGRQVPVFQPPPGLGLLNKVRGEQRWVGWISTPTRFLADAVMVLREPRPVYLQITERKAARTRWIHRVSLQTRDPEEE